MKPVTIALLVLYILASIILVTLALLKNSSPQYLHLKVKESLGYPGLEQTMPNFSLRLTDDNIMVFVSLTSIPSRLNHVEKTMSALPQDQRVRKVLVLPKSLQDSTAEGALQDKSELHKLQAGQRLQVLRTSRDQGPLLKIWAVTDPVTAHKLGALRDKESKHIQITLDDDMQQHQNLVQALVNKIVETDFSSVVAVKTSRVTKVDKSTYPEIIGSQGVAQPARIWTSAFRGDVRSAMMIPECLFDDDAAISFALHRNAIPIVTLPEGDWSVPSSIGSNYDSKSLRNGTCRTSLSNLPILQ